MMRSSFKPAASMIGFAFTVFTPPLHSVPDNAFAWPASLGGNRVPGHLIASVIALGMAVIASGRSFPVTVVATQPAAMRKQKARPEKSGDGCNNDRFFHVYPSFTPRRDCRAVAVALGHVLCLAAGYSPPGPFRINRRILRRSMALSTKRPAR